jgi:penicillin-binding protein activator
MKKKIFSTILIVFLALSSLSAKSVKRGAEEDSTVYLSVRDADAVCKDIVQQIITYPRIERFEDKNGRPPVVTIGKIKDGTGEFFDTQIIANSLKTAILKSGVMEFMANKDIRDELRSEVVEQQDHSAEGTAQELDEEDVADYMLTGSVKIMIQNTGRKQERSYLVNIELSDLKTHRTVGMFEPSDDVKEYLRKIGKSKR